MDEAYTEGQAERCATIADEIKDLTPHQFIKWLITKQASTRCFKNFIQRNRKGEFMAVFENDSISGHKFLTMRDEEFESICLKTLLPLFVKLLSKLRKGLIAGDDIFGLPSTGPNPHWDYYQRLHKAARETAPESPDDYGNLSKIHEIPFFSPMELRNERFSPKEPNENTFRYYGRASFKTLLAEVDNMKAQGQRLLYLHGTLGSGKSYVLAALACYLVRRGDRVVFLADCPPLAKALVRGIKTALCLSFANKPQVITHIAKIRVARDIEDFCNEIADSEKIYFLIDQANALDQVSQSGRDRVDEEDKAAARRLLDNITGLHIKIQSSSGNYVHSAHDSLVLANEIRLPMYGGLNEDEIKKWWNATHGGLAWSELLDKAEKDKIEDFTGGLPILLSFLSNSTPEDRRMRDQDTTEPSAITLQNTGHGKSLAKVTRIQSRNVSSPQAFALLKEEIENSDTVQSWADMIDKYFNDTFERSKGTSDEPRLVEAYAGYLIGGEVPSNSNLLVDLRFCYVVKDVGRISCGLVRSLAVPFLRLRNHHMFTDHQWYDRLGSEVNPSVTGFLVEQMTLSYLAQHGCNKLNMVFNTRKKQIGPSWKVNHFWGELPQPTNHTTLYYPLKWNFSAVDAILVKVDSPTRGSMPTTHTITGIQLTLLESGAHKSAEVPFLRKAKHWASNMGKGRAIPEDSDAESAAPDDEDTPHEKGKGRAITEDNEGSPDNASVAASPAGKASSSSTAKRKLDADLDAGLVLPSGKRSRKTPIKYGA